MIFFNSNGVVPQKSCKPGEMITGRFDKDSMHVLGEELLQDGSTTCKNERN